MDTLAEVLAEVRKIEIRARGMVREEFGGEYHSSFKGQGIDFKDLREYSHGDEVRSIDWNTTARTGVPHVKQFVEERELTVYLAIDISPSGTYGSRRHSTGRRRGHAVGDGLSHTHGDALDDANLAFSLGDFELGHVGLGHQVDQRFQFS